jgi:type IV secretory pathway TrbD component
MSAFSRNADASVRLVHKAVHRPLTLAGVDRRLFFLSLIMGAAAFNLLYSLLAGILVTVVLYAFSLWATRRDPRMLTILLSSSRTRTRYDAMKYDAFASR